ncbi:MAG: ABC transporter ATP-binding protein [Candidatus Dadabacteria bacterium]|nr:MAG: ABC transporter ATP-binding protein [Candidatus Dadabacteria bacterium]
MMALLEAEQLVSVFPTQGEPVRAVDGVDLHIDEGETVCLVGESGCGKSAFALSAMGLMPSGRDAHPNGRLHFDGEDVLKWDEQRWCAIRGRDIGMIFQEPMTSLNPVIRVGTQLMEPLLIHGLANRTDARRQAIEALARVGIPQPDRMLERYPHELSGGMRQRVMIAIATICRPRLLIADEPTTALDVTVEAQILELLADLKQQHGMAMLFITHDLGVVAELADRVYVMYAGQIVESGTLAQVFDQPGHPYTQGLLRSMPRRHQRGRRLYTIPGTVPPPHQRPSGCRFAPRCPYADAACEQPVTLRDLAAGHTVRCVHPDRARSQQDE